MNAIGWCDETWNPIRGADAGADTMSDLDDALTARYGPPEKVAS